MVQHGTNRPLSHMRVTVTRNDHPDQQASVITAEDDRFTFTGVPPGKYSLLAQLRGEQRAFEQDGPYSTGIVTGPLLDSSHILFTFPAPASLSIHVIDEEGDPVSGAQLWLFHRKIDAGWAQIQMMRQSATGAEGSARFSHLEAGTYYVGAGGQAVVCATHYTRSSTGARKRRRARRRLSGHLLRQHAECAECFASPHIRKRFRSTENHRGSICCWPSITGTTASIIISRRFDLISAAPDAWSFPWRGTRQ